MNPTATITRSLKAPPTEWTDQEVYEYGVLMVGWAVVMQLAVVAYATLVA